MRIAFKTFGCRANSNDTDALYLEARRRGFEVVPETDSADAYVINTCTVTENADRDARQQAFRFKRQNQGALIAMVGCYAQVAKDEILKLPEVDFVIGTANKFKVLEHFQSALKGEAISRDQVEPAKGFLPEHFPGSRNSRATVKIQDGCNYRCSFCIIPTARGRSRSLPLQTIVSQVEEASEQGFREVVLTGIHLAHYGWDQGTDLYELIRKLVSLPNGPRIRVSSLDPFEIPDGLIDMLGVEEKLCPHFHIALQSGSDKVLSDMRRIYKAREFVEVTQKIRAKNPDTFVGADVIVGFPGEGEKEFLETVQCLSDSFWAKLHVFSFSSREGTAAVTLPNHIPADIIAERSERLRLISEHTHNQFLESQIGKLKNVLLEKQSRKNPGMWQGHTENYLPTLTEISGDGLAKTIIRSVVVGIKGDFVIARSEATKQSHGMRSNHEIASVFA
jgi:threonylcarbamoyladenosine tRNA methylthiotransferase MtaB